MQHFNISFQKDIELPISKSVKQGKLYDIIYDIININKKQMSTDTKRPTNIVFTDEQKEEIRKNINMPETKGEVKYSKIEDVLINVFSNYDFNTQRNELVNSKISFTIVSEKFKCLNAVNNEITYIHPETNRLIFLNSQGMKVFYHD